MIVAVTGGTGFIGKRLVERLLARGDGVRLLTRRASSAFAESPQLDVCECDLLTAGVDDLTSMLNGVDVLYHCAGQLTDRSSMRPLHVDATRKLIEAASGRVGRWVQLSSVGVYGPVRSGVVTEVSELNPHGEYESTKCEADLLLIGAAKAGRISYSILRPSNVYGAGMSNGSLYGLIGMVRRGWFFFIGAPGASANYIHVDNVIDALLMCGALPQAAGHIYNLSDHRTIEQFVAAIAHSLGKDAPHLRMPERVIRPLAGLLGNLPGAPLTVARVDALTGRSVYSTAKIERELGYTHRVSMEDGLAGLVGYWQEKETGSA